MESKRERIAENILKLKADANGKGSFLEVNLSFGNLLDCNLTPSSPVSGNTFVQMAKGNKRTFWELLTSSSPLSTSLDPYFWKVKWYGFLNDSLLPHFDFLWAKEGLNIPKRMCFGRNAAPPNVRPKCDYYSHQCPTNRPSRNPSTAMCYIPLSWPQLLVTLWMNDVHNILSSFCCYHIP